MKKSKIIQKTVKLFLAFVMFLGVLFQNSSLTSAQGTEVDRVNTKITRFEIKNHDGTPALGYHYWNQYRLDMDWDASSYGNQLKQGDYFIVKLPEQFKFPTDGPTVDFKLYAPDGKTVVANAHVNSNGEQGGGTVKVTFTKYVENRENVKGNLYLQAGFAHSKINVGGDNIIDIQIGSVKKSTNIKIGPKPTIKNETFAKWGATVPGNDNQAKWVLRINHIKGNYSNLTISDRLYVDEGNLPPTIHYIRDSFVLYELEYDQYGNTSRVINIYKYNDLKDFIKFSENDTQFTFEYSKKFGDINGRQYRLTYNTTYIPQLKLKNEGTFKSTEKNVVYRSWFKNAEAGGTGQGDLIQKIKIFKVDENDRQIKLPNAEFLITKVKDGSTFTLKTDAQGEAVSEKLEAGKYKIKETKAPDGYILDPTEKEVNVVEGEVLFWTATNAKITNIDIAGKKTWDDANNQDGKRPDKIKVILKKTVDGTTTTVAEKEVKADTDGNWKYEFNNLPKYENGKLITYSIDEEGVPGYTKSKDGYNLKNTRTPEKVSIAGVKSWDDSNNQDGKRPDKIKVILNKTVDGQTTKVTEKEVTKENNWSYEFNDLPKYENGKEITYSIDEEAVPGYEKSTDGYNLKNKYTPEKVSIAGKKIWDDKNNQDRKRPDKIKVILNKTVDGVKTKVTEKEVTVLTNWRYEFNNLPKYENGKLITYSIDEEAVPGYEKIVDGYNLNNKYVPEKVAISGKKIWDDNHNEHGKRPDKIKVILNKTVNGKTTKVAEKEVTEQDNWSYTFADLPKYENGKKIKYSIDEKSVEGYKKSVEGYNLTNKYIPPKPKLPKTGATTSELGGLGILGVLTGLLWIRRKNKTN
ncbi:Cna B-type domain-containing protein [Gemella morbillorum]